MINNLTLTRLGCFEEHSQGLISPKSDQTLHQHARLKGGMAAEV
jgi:hypothetical protein